MFLERLGKSEERGNVALNKSLEKLNGKRATVFENIHLSVPGRVQNLPSGQGACPAQE